ncbi:voltage-dependent calcium channel subunit alpha-2/delta-3-like [Chironomus tepperi]|uniref:voltage-dependent calcium channel subunit alpha-2/delta-3-like n=1 Tax=Chironomus tepperi TaxID=113505 RepID=UPI00391EF41E
MTKVNVILVLIMINFYTKISGAQSLDAIDFEMVQQLSKQIGGKLLDIAETVTKRSEVQESFSQAKVVSKNGKKIVEEIAKDLHSFLHLRIDAVKRIALEVQKIPKIQDNSTMFANYTFRNIRQRDKHKKELDKEKEAKNLRLEQLSQETNYTKKRKPNFDAPVCIKSDIKDLDGDGEDDDDDKEKISSFSEEVDIKSKEAGVFVPVDVYDKDINITKIIHRSKSIDKAFEANYKEDPTIGWQYFCNSSGLFRHYPATSWNFYPMNIYDCRMRHWFTNAATSSKDIIILIEQSGSMVGTRLDIAIDVVRNILDTLTINDFVNVFSFNDTIRPIIECKNISDKLIQATSANIFELKQALGNIEAEDQTDLAEALNHTFKLLSQTRERGSHCNQAIMLITDGMEYNKTIQDIFKVNNWDKGNQVRVFSYLIGEMIPEHDYEQVKLMACENRGYYVQIDTKTETREQVLKYLPVMARPLALNRTQNPIIWSAVYADIMDAYRITNYDWNCKQRDMQRARMVDYLKHYQYYPCIRQDEDDDDPPSRKYVFMTTVAMPAFEQDTKSSSLHGVVGIDVPLYEFERLFQQFRLGVNGYAFVIDENGYIFAHPDFRPFFQHELLKPSFNSVDMVEVELIDDSKTARDFNPGLLAMRKSMIDNNLGSNILPIVQHYDDMHRAMRFNRHYYWKKIDQTPFTVVVTFPGDAQNQIQIPDHEKGSKSILKYFQGNYRLHPEWIYCRSLRKNFEDIKLGQIDPDDCEMSPEEELEYYIEKFEKSGWKWKTGRNEKGAYKCDQKLVQAVMFDAKATEKFPQIKSSEIKPIFKKYKIYSTFISTHSGLLRFKIFEDDELENKKLSDEFGNSFKNSIDEDWYKHAVEFNRHESLDKKSFIYSLPFDAQHQDHPLITVTSTVYATNGDESAPVAVVGFQFPHEELENLFGDKCAPHVEQTCYILDSNAYIIADSRRQHKGKFFGSVENILMNTLMVDNIYKFVTVYDYQGVCYEDRNIEYELLMNIVSSATTIFWHPLKHLWTTFIALLISLKNIIVDAVSRTYVPNLMYPDPQYYYKDDKSAFCPHLDDGSFERCLTENGVKEKDNTTDEYKKCMENLAERLRKCRMGPLWSEFMLKRHFNRTRPIKCDKFNQVYMLNLDASNFSRPYNKCERPFVVQRIANSNLILLIKKSDCEKNGQLFEIYNEPSNVINYAGNEGLFCEKLQKPLYRKHSKSCYTHHTNEPKPLFDGDRTFCGRGNRIELKGKIVVITSLILMMLKFL